MKNFRKKSILIALAVSSLFVLAGAGSALAATSPDLGDASSYSVLSGAGATNGGAGTTTISGDFGVSPAATYTDGGITVFLTPGNPHLADAAAADAQFAQKAVFDGPLDFVAQPCTVTYAVTTELSTAGPLDPGVYCTDPGADFTLSGTLTLNGTGATASNVWIFRSQRDLIGSGTANVVFTGTGGLACNVWWRIANNATFTANNEMVGNILAANSITFGQSATLDGRAFAYTGAVTLLGNTISEPTCQSSSINVVKTVINDSGGTQLAADFPLFVNGAPVISGVTNTFPAPFLYTVTETTDPQYIQTFSGDCDSSGVLTLGLGDNLFCVVTNRYRSGSGVGGGGGGGSGAGTTEITLADQPVLPVPPLISIVKVPNPLALPDGPGPVTYTYTLRNIGTVPVTDITMVGDTCSPIVLVSGDTNSDAILDVDESWVYRCSTTLTETHTNTIVATGWANGISAVDIASATVVVGVPVVPPLIHVVKVPSPLTLPAEGGMVTYTATVTNPGIVPLTNVTLTDDMCSPMRYVSGDTNGDDSLDITETWTYTCQANVTETMTNTVIASGEANGLTIRDFAIAPVVVSAVDVSLLRFAAPGFPNTGFAPAKNIALLPVALGGIFAALLIFFTLRMRKKSL